MLAYKETIFIWQISLHVEICLFKFMSKVKQAHYT